MSELTVENLHLAYGDNPILKGVTMTLNRGEVVALLGPSGSGKTTLLRVIAGFERPDSGVVTLGERSLVKPGVFVRPERRGIGIVPQDGALFPHLDVASNVAFGLRHTVADRLSPRRRHTEAARVEELLGLVGLDGFQRRRVDQLSGGQQQRVALARALAPDVTVNAIAPGAVLVPDEYDAAERDRLARTTPLARLGRPEDAVAALLYLLEGGDYVTGEVLVVDGGLVI